MLKKIIKYALILFILCVILLFFFQLNRNNPRLIARNLALQSIPVTDAKTLVFRVHLFGFFPVGIAEIKNEGIEFYKDRKVCHISASAEAVGFVGRLYPARARLDSYVDQQKLHSLRFTQSLILPKKPQGIKEVLYDQDNNIMELRGERRHILPDTQDNLSAIFYIQHQQLEKGKTFDINVNTNQKNYRLLAHVSKRIEFALGNSKVGIWVVQADIRRRDKNNPYHRSSMTIYLLDDANKTPILIKVSASGFYITARLIGTK
jgi:hypothetical protein